MLHVGDIAYDLRDNAGTTGDEFVTNLEPIAYVSVMAKRMFSARLMIK